MLKKIDPPQLWPQPIPMDHDLNKLHYHGMLPHNGQLFCPIDFLEEKL